MTIKNLYPPNRPTSIYNVVNGRPELPVASSFTRDTEATYINRAGEMKIAADNEPRFNYDYNTGEFLGLLLEESSTNLAKNSALIRTDVAAMPDEFRNFNPIAKPTSAVPFDNICPGGGPAWFNAATTSSGGGLRPQSNVPQLTSGQYAVCSIWVRQPTAEELEWFKNNNEYGTDVDGKAWFAADEVRFSFRPGSGGTTFDRPIGPEWALVSASVLADTARLDESSWDCIVSSAVSTGVNSERIAAVIVIGGYQIEAFNKDKPPTSFMVTDVAGSNLTRDADEFSLTTTEDFDNGFSLLLDSVTTTDDFIYKIKASGTTVASLNNDNGTLDWQIGDPPTSAQIQDTYPQIGFVKGRVRTISSFTEAGDDVNPNYLYTKGLSFPTIGAPGSGADELEFGVPQTLKAFYVWSGQLSKVIQILFLTFLLLRISIPLFITLTLQMMETHQSTYPTSFLRILVVV